MADDNQEMEEILSSIKDILEEDEKNQQNSENQVKEPDVLEDVLSNQEADDILELSPDMRVSEEEKVPVAEFPEFLNEDPVLDREPAVEIDPVKEAEPALEKEPIIEAAPTIEVESATEAEFTSKEEPVVEADSVMEDASIAKDETAVEPEQKDVSAGIISNFAKMFAHEEENQKFSPVTEHVTTIGNASKSLEDFVRDAVIRVVGEEIKKQWNEGADYQVFAETEIKRQTEEWINKNLQTMVETIIKQEITRVIAKVGS